MFLTSGLFPDILYAFNSILAGVITGVFLLASLMQTGRLRKAVYVSCGIVSLILISPIAVYYSFGKPAVCLLAGTLAAFFFGRRSATNVFAVKTVSFFFAFWRCC